MFCCVLGCIAVGKIRNSFKKNKSKNRWLWLWRLQTHTDVMIASTQEIKIIIHSCLLLHMSLAQHVQTYQFVFTRPFDPWIEVKHIGSIYMIESSFWWYSLKKSHPVTNLDKSHPIENNVWHSKKLANGKFSITEKNCFRFLAFDNNF